MRRIYHHYAVCAAANGAEHSPGFMQLCRIAVDLDSVGFQRHGNRLAFVPFKSNTVVFKGDKASLFEI